MRCVVQKVNKSSVTVYGKLVSEIGRGLNVLVGFTDTDTEEDIKYCVRKIVNLRVFEDENDVMNKSVLDEKGEILSISQFTLYGDTRKGNRPSFRSPSLWSHPVHRARHPDGSHTASFPLHPCRIRR